MGAYKMAPHTPVKNGLICLVSPCRSKGYEPLHPETAKRAKKINPH